MNRLSGNYPNHDDDEFVVDAPIVASVPAEDMARIPSVSVASDGSNGRPISYRPSAASHGVVPHSSAGQYRASVGIESASHPHHSADEEMAMRLQEQEVANHIAATQVTPADRRPHILKQVSSFAAWQVDKERFGYCLGEAKIAKFCWLMVLFCVVMFIVEMGVANWTIEELSVNPTVGPSVAVLLKLGAKRADLIVDGKEYYRLFAPMVLHGGVVHLLFNMIGLANIGMPLEHEYGTLKVMYIYLTSGFMGVLISCIFLPYSVGVGASGAIFGLFGAAWADLIQNWSLYKEQQISKRMLCQLAFGTILNLGIGTLPYLDNFAHVGGFVNGVFAGLTVLIQDRFNRFGELKEKKTYQACLQILAITVTPLSMIIALIVLFMKIDAGDCKWCGYIDCIPTEYWSCDACANSDLKASLFTNNNTVVLTCPNKGGLYYQAFNSSVTVGTNEVIAACRAGCEN